jgi:DNA-binding NarL/FixJ family response regulator
MADWWVFAAFHPFLTGPPEISNLDALVEGAHAVPRVLRRSLRYLLEAEDVTVVGEAGDGPEAVTLAGELAPDVVVMDLRLPTMNGLEATKRIRQALPGTQVVLFTAQDDATVGQQASDAGAYGWLAKGCSDDELIGLILEAHQAARTPYPRAPHRPA